MSFVRISFFATMLSVIVNAVSQPIQDISNECAKNEAIKYYLSTGFGESDAVALMIANDKQFRCTLGFYAQPRSSVNMVIEFPDSGKHDSVCIIEENSVVSVSEYHGQEKCKIVRNNDVYSKVGKRHLVAQVVSEGNLNTVKVTVTALRFINSSRCTDTEVPCAIDENYYCISSILLCDGNKNCGDRFFSDEKECGNRSLSLLVIVSTIAMIVTTIWIILSILMNIFPNRGRTFIYRIDERMSPYDYRFSSLNIEVTVLVVFPPESSE